MRLFLGCSPLFSRFAGCRLLSLATTGKNWRPAGGFAVSLLMRYHQIDDGA